MATARPRETPLRELLRMARTHALLVILVAAVTGAAAAAATAAQPPRYRATVTLVVDAALGPNDSETFIRSLAALLDSEALGADIRESTGLDLTPQEIVDRIDVERPPGSGVLSVAVEGTNPDRVHAIASSVGPVFSSRVSLVFPEGLVEDGTSRAVRSWDAEPSVVATAPPSTRNTALGIVLGFALGVAIAALREQHTPLVRSRSDVEGAFGLPTVAALPQLRSRQGKRLNALDSIPVLLERAAASGWPEAPRSVLLASPRDTSMTRQLAIAMTAAVAGTGRNVVLVDADVGSGQLSSDLGHAHSIGLSEALVGRSAAAAMSLPLEPEILPSWIPRRAAMRDRMRFVPVGRDRSIGALASPQLPRILASVAEPDDLVIVVAPATAGDSNVGLLLSSVEAVLAVGVSNSTPIDEAAELGSLIARAGAPGVAILYDAPAFEMSGSLDPRSAGPNGTAPGANAPGAEERPGTDPEDQPTWKASTTRNP